MAAMARQAAVERRWLGVAVVAAPFETIAACDTCVKQNSSQLTNHQKGNADGTRTRQEPSW